MATTLVNLRAILNDELGVPAAQDSEAAPAPFPLTLRNRAIAQGYAALWRAGCWKPATQDIATTDDTSSYTTTIRRLRVVDLLDDTGLYTGSHPPARIEEVTPNSYRLLMGAEIGSGATLRVNGWTAYVSVFASDSAQDDLDTEYNRIPLLKAKAICYRKVLADFARYGERQVVPAEMNVTVDQALGLVAAAEREFAEETRAWAGQRDKFMQPRHSRPFAARG
jgi:hypothetical protein